MQPTTLIMQIIMCRCFFLFVLCRHIPLIPPRKKMTFERRFRTCERVVHVVEMAGIFADCSTTINKTSLLWQSTHVGRTSSMTGVLRLPTLLKNIFNTLANVHIQLGPQTPFEITFSN
jgi:hypothetical protein